MRIEGEEFDPSAVDGGGGVAQQPDVPLERVVLELPNIELTSEFRYAEVLQVQAVPIVDLLVQLEEAGVQRGVDSPLARFDSIRVTESGNTESDWNRVLGFAIADLGHAAGLSVSVFGVGLGPDGTGFEMPFQFREALAGLQFTPALQRRIDSRREEIDSELESVSRDTIVYTPTPVRPYRQPHFDLFIDRKVGNRPGTKLPNFRNTVSVAAQLSPGQRVSR